MLDYRIYEIDEGGHVRGPPMIVTCDSDGRVIQQAQLLVDGYALEVWQRDRVVIAILPKR